MICLVTYDLSLIMSNNSSMKLRIETMLGIWNILITDSGDTVTNADELLIKSAQLRYLKVPFD